MGIAGAGSRRRARRADDRRAHSPTDTDPRADADVHRAAHHTHRPTARASAHVRTRIIADITGDHAAVDADDAIDAVIGQKRRQAGDFCAASLARFKAESRPSVTK